MELGREGKGIQNLFTISQGRFLFYKRNWGRYIHSDEGITRQAQEGLDVSDAAALNPTLLHGSTVNPVTDILGFQTGEQPCVGIYLFVMYLVFPRGAPEAGKEFRSRCVL